MTKLPWQGKETKANHKVFVATKPGECVLVDPKEVGFYAGKPTKKRYKCATIFVDHFSHLQFFHLQLDDKSNELLAAKLAFKQYAAELKILHYHCNNGCFHDNAFQQACQEARQQLTFCGVDAHFQNDITEQAIRDLLESAWKQLLHARARWPEAV